MYNLPTPASELEIRGYVKHILAREAVQFTGTIGIHLCYFGRVWGTGVYHGGTSIRQRESRCLLLLYDGIPQIGWVGERETEDQVLVEERRARCKFRATRSEACLSRRYIYFVFEINQLFKQCSPSVCR